MKLFFAIATVLAAPTLVAAFRDVNHVLYTFDPQYAGGVSGTIQTIWNDGIMSDRVTIKANLNFKRLDLAALAKADGNCTGPVTEYMWHIHTKWSPPPNTGAGSASFAQCSKAITGNHYDPNKACGPASEYSDTPECASKIKDYKCTPERYLQSPTNCEAGDLSGKFGSFKVNKKGVAKAKWTDSLYPRWDDHTSWWSIVVHAVCGKATPRVACAVATKMGPDHKRIKAHEATQMKRENNDDHDEDDDDDDATYDNGQSSKSSRKSAAVRDITFNDEDAFDEDDEVDAENTVLVKIYVNKGE